MLFHEVMTKKKHYLYFTMMRIFTFILLFFATLATMAQDTEQPKKKLVVADIETHVPLRNAIVVTPKGYRDTTNYRGICYIPETFDTLIVYRSSYLVEKLLSKEVRDTTFLIPSGKSIKEVTVWGKSASSRLTEGIDEQKKRILPNSNGTGVVTSFDFARMLDARYRRDQKHLRNVRQKFREMDKVDDPIEKAYLQALEEKKYQEELKKKEEESKARQQQKDLQEITKKQEATKEQEQKEENKQHD